MGNLRDRLKRIQQVQQGKGESPALQRTPLPKPVSDLTVQTNLPGWNSAGYLTLKREMCGSERCTLPVTMPKNAGIVMPGLAETARYEDLRFFDLETTGLSGGAGTVAFLAAFGRLIANGKTKTKTAVYKLNITQYLLLDYPGQNDFIEAVLGEINRNGGNTTIVSYNGKSFDSQILKTMCLMNGIKPPEYRHADLLHPSRRLWKRLLPDCSQGTIETAILGIDRTGDIPGALAPEIWFSFLKTGGTEPLLGICEHNRRDITGLASVFCAITAITNNPIEVYQKIPFDMESLALRLGDTALLRYAAGKALAGEHPPLRPIALRALAVNSEHHGKNPSEALEFAEQGLNLLPSDTTLKKDFERRIQRLRKKLIV